MKQTYARLDALDAALEELMRRRGVTSWLKPEFDANDIYLLMHELCETDYIEAD